MQIMHRSNNSSDADVAELLKRSEQQGNAWRELMSKLESKHKREREALRIAHLCEISNAYRSTLVTEGE